MNDRKEYIDKFANQLKQWDSDIQVLREKIKLQANNAKADLQKEINNLESQRNILKIKLDKLKEADSEVWKDLRQGTEKNWAEFKKRVSDITGKMN